MMKYEMVLVTTAFCCVTRCVSDVGLYHYYSRHATLGSTVTSTETQWQHLPGTQVSRNDESLMLSPVNSPSLTWCTSVCWFLHTISV